MLPPKGFFYGKEWFNSFDGKVTTTSRTRAGQQEFIDNMYVNGKIDHDKWSTLTDDLSNLKLWAATGKCETVH